MEISLFVIILLLTFAFSVCFSFFLIRSYSNTRDATALTTIISTAAVLVTLFCILLIPLDIYSVSSGLNADGSHENLQLVEDSRNAIKYPDEGERTKSSTKVWSATKWTGGFLAFFLVLMGCGLVVRQGHKEGDDWKSRLGNQFSEGDSILGFAMGTLGCIGLVIYVVYAAYGIARLPLSLMTTATTDSPKSDLTEPILITTTTRPGARKSDKPKSASSMSTADISLALKRIIENISYLESQNSSDLSPADRNQLDSLTKERRKLENVLQNRLNDLESNNSNRSRANNSDTNSSNNNKSGSKPSGFCISRVWNCIAPFRIVFAIPLILLSLLIVVSLSITVIDKLLHSSCGPSCGYILAKPTILNPLDEALKGMSSLFPIDAIAFAGLCLYIYFCFIHAILALGVRVLVWKLFNIRAGRTAPNALIMAAWMLMFLALVLNLQILTFAPQYTTFGNQFYLESSNKEILGNTMETDKVACTVDQSQFGGGSNKNNSLAIHNTDSITQFTSVSVSPPDVCRMTAIATFLNTLNIQMPFFAVILFYSNLIFLLLFIAFFIRGLFKTKEQFGDYKPLTVEEKLDEDSD